MTAIIARRGASAYEQPNSEAAFRRAIRMGATHLELEVRRTADDHLVVAADAILDDATILVRQRRAELADDVVDLIVALELCRGIKAHVLIHNDPSDPDYAPDAAFVGRIVQVLNDVVAPRQLLVCSADDAVLSVVRASSSLPTAKHVLIVDDEVISSAVACGDTAIVAWVEMLDRSTIDRVVRAGLDVYARATNDRAQMRTLVRWGVSGIITDMPDVAVEVRTALCQR